MASIQQLEKLYHIQSLCHAEDSLESAVATERVAQAIKRTEQLIRQRAFLREERRRLRISSERLEQRKAALKMMQRPDWVPSNLNYMLIDPPKPPTPASTTTTASTSALATVAKSSSSEEKGLGAKPEVRDEKTTPSQPNPAAAAPAAAPAAVADAKNTQQGPMAPVPQPMIKETTLRVNVSGLMFETPVSILCRDPDSLLAQLCNGLPGARPGEPPLLPDPDGFYYFDRDWWLFRYLLQFLRDGSLPDDRSLLAQLYREAGFFHLNELQRAIEEEKLHLRPPPAPSSSSSSGGGNGNGTSSGSSGNVSSSNLGVNSSSGTGNGNASVSGKGGDAKDGKGANDSKEQNKKWWRTLPTWTQAVEESKKKEEQAKKNGESGGGSRENDWWTGTSYKGKTYLPLSNDPEKVVTKAGEKDEQPLPKGTWATFRYDEDPSLAHGMQGLGLGHGQYGGQYGGGSGSGGAPQQSYVYGIPSPSRAGGGGYGGYPGSGGGYGNDRYGGGGGGYGNDRYGGGGGGGYGGDRYGSGAYGGDRYSGDRYGGPAVGSSYPPREAPPSRGTTLYDPYAYGGGRYGQDRLAGFQDAPPRGGAASVLAPVLPPQGSGAERPMGQLDVMAAAGATRSRWPDRDVLLSRDGELYPPTADDRK